jgi:hypothetical protein
MLKQFSGKYKIINQGVSITLVLVFSFLAISQVALASEITPAAVIKLVNDSRVSSGITELKENKKLDQVAKDKVQDMITYKYFSHNSPSGATPWDWFEKNKYNYKYAGENLAMDFYSAEKQHQAWMDSATHRKNILNPAYLEIGVAVSQGMINGHIATITVQMFGAQDKTGATVKASTPKETPVETEGKFKVLDEGLISSKNQPLFSGVTLNKNGSNPFSESALGASNNEFPRMSELTYRLPSGTRGVSFRQSAGLGNYEMIEIFIWLMMILILSFSIILNTRTLIKSDKRSSVPASGIIIFLAILTTAMFCELIFRKLIV